MPTTLCINAIDGSVFIKSIAFIVFPRASRAVFEFHDRLHRHLRHFNITSGNGVPKAQHLHLILICQDTKNRIEVLPDVSDDKVLWRALQTFHLNGIVWQAVGILVNDTKRQDFVFHKSQPQFAIFDFTNDNGLVFIYGIIIFCQFKCLCRFRNAVFNRIGNRLFVSLFLLSQQTAASRSQNKKTQR